jgi:hypothetical protein
MNGRVYDYNLGRFLSVDPFIQEPGNSQSMNPYSYIMNNPLSGTDPSGYVSDTNKVKERLRDKTVTGSRIKRDHASGSDSSGGGTYTNVGGSNVTATSNNRGNGSKLSGSGGSGVAGGTPGAVSDTNDIGSQNKRDSNNEPKLHTISDDIDADDMLDFTISDDGTAITFNMSYQCSTQRACTSSKSAFESISNTSKSDDGTSYSLIVNMRIHTEDSSGAPDFYLTDVVHSTSAAGDYLKSRKDSFFFGTTVNDKIGFNKSTKLKTLIKPRTGTAVHELGHRLGLQHQLNKTGRLMSYARYRQPIGGSRIKDMISAYQNLKKE